MYQVLVIRSLLMKDVIFNGWKTLLRRSSHPLPLFATKCLSRLKTGVA